MRKIICISVLFCFLFANSCFAFSGETSGTHSAIQALSALGIVEGCDDGSFHPQDAVTRAEFTAMLARVFGFDARSMSSGHATFMDVPASHWAAGCIDFGVSLGLVTGYGDNTFRPENDICYSEAIKVLVSAVGYSSVAKQNGGYPDGYMTIAARTGIIKNVQFVRDEAATRENVAKLLYQTMQVEIADPVYGQNDLYELSNETLMDRLMDSRNLSKATGIVTHTSKTALKGEPCLHKNQACIDNIVYDQGTLDMEPFLGMRVKVYFYQAMEDEIPVITSVVPFNNLVLTIQADDLLNVDLNARVIEHGNGEREHLAQDCPVIYNGKALSNVTAADLELINGSITLIDNSGDSAYDVVFINESFNVVVEKVSEVMQIIFLKSGTVGGLPRINLDMDRSDFAFALHDADGNDLELSDLSENDVLSVKADKQLSLIDITVYAEKISGVITEYSYDGNEVVINGKTYRVAKNEEGLLMFTPNLNESGYYYAANDEIVYFEKGDFILEGLGLIQGISSSASLSDGHKLRLLTGGILEELVDKGTDAPYAEVGNSNWTIYETEEKIRFYNKRTPVEEVLRQLKSGDLIRYELNSEGKIDSIDLRTPEAELLGEPYNPEIKSFGGEFYVDETTAVFCMPTNDADVEDYFTKITLDSGIEYDISGYEIDEKTQVAKAVVIRQEMIGDQPGKISNAKEIVVINKMFSRLEGDGQILELNGFMDGEEISTVIKDEAEVYSIAKGLRFGDVVYISKNSLGYVDNIEFVKSLVPAPDYFHEGQRLQNEKVFGRLHTITRNRLDKSTNQQMSAITVNLGMGEDANQELVEIRIPTKKMPVVYMVDAMRKKINVITLDDLFSTEEVGYAGASDVMICKKKYDVTGIVVLK